MSLTRKGGAGSSDPRVRTARPFRVISFDPGGTTGVASAQYYGPEPLTRLDQIKFGAWHLTGDHYEDLWVLLSKWYVVSAASDVPLEIVYESFEFRQHIGKDKEEKHKVELMSKEYIGIIKLFGQMYPETSLFTHTASAAKQFIPDKGPQANVRLKALGLYQPGMVHAMDAQRHLLRHLVVTKKIRSPITDAWL